MLAVSVYSFRRHLVDYMRLINLIRILWEYITLTEYPNDGGENGTSYVMFVVCPLSFCFQVLFHLHVWPKSSALRWETYIISIHIGSWTEAGVIRGSWGARSIDCWLLSLHAAASETSFCTSGFCLAGVGSWAVGTCEGVQAVWGPGKWRYLGRGGGLNCRGQRDRSTGCPCKSVCCSLLNCLGGII